jgi:prophage tail gpP-like protein
VTGKIITDDHKTYVLPPLLTWEILRTGSVPCDSFCVTCPLSAEMAATLRRAVSFSAWNGGALVLRGIVDECVLRTSGSGAAAELTGRGLAARLLDNESRPVTYQTASLQDILRSHAAPYGIAWKSCAAVQAGTVYTVAAGSSQWKAIEGFCQTYGGFSPTFGADGILLASPQGEGRRHTLQSGGELLSCTLRDNRYGVLSEVLVIDKTRHAAYSVKNEELLRRGGQCRRVVYTPGQSTWAAMRYTGEYQIARSREEEHVLTAVLGGFAAAEIGDSVRVQVPLCGAAGEYRVVRAEYRGSAESGESTTLTLKERQ